MASGVLRRLSSLFKEFDYVFENFLRQGFPPEQLCALNYPGSVNIPVNKQWKELSLKDIIGDGFVWGVPTCRRTIEKRLKRRFGSPQYQMKILLPRADILMCPHCGHDYEEGKLCAHCYEKAKVETKEMQDAIIQNLGLEPIEKDVVVLYEGEKESNFWKDKRIVEMKKSRPEWFHKNLLEATSQQPSDSKDIKSSNVE